MRHISIISSSVREGRKSHNVSLYFQNYLIENKLATTSIIDLKEYNFPIFESTLKLMKNPAGNVIEFADKIKSSDGIIIVTPEYNGGYPASLKNAIDLLLEEWKHKPIGIATVSGGQFGGQQCMVALQFGRAFDFESIVTLPNPRRNKGAGVIPVAICLTYGGQVIVSLVTQDVFLQILFIPLT